MTTRILVADDSPTVRALLQESLTQEGYEVDAASDGVEAIEHLYRNIPDLVLLDIEMPRMNGYQVLRLLREDPLVRDLPVIFLTSKGEKSDRFWGLAVGADAYLVKDSDSWMLLGKIRELLAEQEASGATARSDAPSVPPSPEALLERLNFLLDRKLFQATLVSELAKLARHRLSMREAMNLLFQLLGRVCDFHLAHALLNSGELLTCKAGALGLDFASQADARFREACSKHEMKFEFKERIDFELSDVALRTRGIPRSVAATSDLPLRGRDGVLGILFLASGREGVFNEHVLETLEIFGSGTATALDISIRERELTRAHQQTETTNRTLAAAQAGLDDSRRELAYYRQLATALLDTLRGAPPALPDLPEGCSQELRDLVGAIRSASAR